MKSVTLALLFFFCHFAAAESFSTWRNYSSAQFIAEQDSVAPGQKITVALDVHLKKGWHTYWVNPGDSGSAVKLSLQAKTGAERFDLLTGAIKFPIPERMQAGPITSFVYTHEVLFLANIVVPDSVPVGSPLSLHLDAEWLVCEDVCIPAIDSFDLSLPVKQAADVRPSGQSELFVAWRGKLPNMQTATPAEHRDAATADLKFAKPDEYRGYHFVDFFPLRGAQLSNEKPELIGDSAKETHLRLKVREVGQRRPDLYGLLVLQKGKKLVGLQWGDPSYGFLPPKASASEKPAKAPITSLVWILISAFLGGLILNLMPCVFPVLSIKFFSVMKQSGQSLQTVRAQNFAYAAGVVLSFLLIGAALAGLRGAGHWVGWGFQLQSPAFVLALAWLFFLLALQLFGYFELEWLNPNWGHKLTRREGLEGSFFTGVLAVIVASPCTAPFMGAALGFAISEPLIELLAVFLFMGLGLSFPYLLLAFFPAVSKRLPKPGAWMQTFKELMAFPLLLTSVWLVWLLAQLKGNLAIGLALSGMVLWFFVLWVRSRSRVFAGVVALAVLIGGFQILHGLPDEKAAAMPAADLTWIPYSASALDRDSQQTVFVDFTADWCLTCKLNERLVFSQSSVIDFLKKNQIKLVKGDWTRQDPEITKFLNNYRRAGVPFYIVFGPGAPQGKILPEILTPEIFLREMRKATGGSQ